MKERSILGIQYLRGLAALGVVFCHFGSDLSSIFSFGQTGVFVFFLITGFVNVFSLTKYKYRPQYFFKFMLKRSIRIEPTYISVIILTILLFYILSFMPSFHGETFHFSIGQLLSNIFYIAPFTKYPFYNHVFWTLCVEFQFYILIGLLYFLFDTTIYKTAFIVIFASSVFVHLPNSYYVVFTYAPIFATGLALVNLYNLKSRLNYALLICMFSLVAYKFGPAIFTLITLSSMVIFYFERTIKPLNFLGDISYSLYLTHGLVFIITTGILKRLGVDTSQNQFIWLIAEVFFAIATAYIFYLIIELPSKHLSKRVFYKN